MFRGRDGKSAYPPSRLLEARQTEEHGICQARAQLTTFHVHTLHKPLSLNYQYLPGGKVMMCGSDGVSLAICTSVRTMYHPPRSNENKDDMCKVSTVASGVPFLFAKGRRGWGLIPKAATLAYL